MWEDGIETLDALVRWDGVGRGGDDDDIAAGATASDLLSESRVSHSLLAAVLLVPGLHALELRRVSRSDLLEPLHTTQSPCFIIEQARLRVGVVLDGIFSWPHEGAGNPSESGAESALVKDVEAGDGQGNFYRWSELSMEPLRQ